MFSVYHPPPGNTTKSCSAFRAAPLRQRKFSPRRHISAAAASWRVKAANKSARRFWYETNPLLLASDVLALLLCACASGGAANLSPLAGVFPDQTSAAHASYFSGGISTDWELTAEELADLETWALGLDLAEQSFPEGRPPATGTAAAATPSNWGTSPSPISSPGRRTTSCWETPGIWWKIPLPRPYPSPARRN